MLEFGSLLLRPWAPGPGAGRAGGAPPRWRAILEPGSGVCLGLARELSPAPGLGGWFAGPGVEVYEGPDESLLLVVRPLWGVGGSWEVLDADQHRVGKFSRSRLRDQSGRTLATLDRRGNPGGRLVAPGGGELGTLADSERGTVLTFSPALANEPFARMTLLGVALLRGGGA